MRSLLTLGLISFALVFCGLQDKLKSISGGGSNAGSSNSSSSSSGAPEKPKLTAAQQSVRRVRTRRSGTTRVSRGSCPRGGEKMDVKKESFNYQSPDNAFLLANISVMPDSFPMDTSLNAYHEQALQQLKNGKYESVKLVEIDGIPGVEFTEAAARGQGRRSQTSVDRLSKLSRAETAAEHHDARPRHRISQSTLTIFNRSFIR
mgnify:CR=1 FL=1